jgi:hypothetical protein
MSEPVTGDDSFIINQAARTLKQKVKRTYSVHGLTRLPLGLTQPRQADEIMAIRSARPQLRQADIVCDAGGLGAGLADTLDERGVRPLIRIVFSGGEEVNRLAGSKRFSVPKVQLIGSLDGAVQNGELEVAPGVAGAELLLKEADAFKRGITQAGRTTLNARVGAHDDLICALALCTWWSKQRRKHQIYINGRTPLGPSAFSLIANARL